MSSYLAQYVDRGLTVGEDSPEAIQAAEIERLAKLLTIATAAQGIPRRLGKDATDEELSADKVRCKRIAHVALGCMNAWIGKGKTPKEVVDVKREAAMVDWSRWWEQHRTWLINRRMYIATWATSNDVDEKWAKSALVKLTNELTWLEYAMR